MLLEKEELVNLVIHINNANGYAASDASSNIHANGTDTDENCSNPFDQIKQTCQNLFTSFTDKIASDLNFDIKQSSSGTGHQNIFTQPRSTSRMPQQFSYNSRASSSNNFHQPPPPPPPPQNSVPTVSTSSAASETNNGHCSPQSSTASSTATSPINSQHSATSSNIVTAATLSPSSPAPNASKMKHTSNHSRVRQLNKAAADGHSKQTLMAHDSSTANGNTFCDCSDDEVINRFQTTYRQKSNELDAIDPEAGPSGSGGNSTKTGTGSSDADADVTKVQPSLDDSSTASSFEELGAVGGITATLDKEIWQFISKAMVDERTCDRRSSKSELDLGNPASFQHQQSSNQKLANVGCVVDLAPGPQQSAVASDLTRRRSDSFVIMNSRGVAAAAAPTVLTNVPMNQSTDNFHDHTTDDPVLHERRRKKSKPSCQKCGKGKGSLRKHLEKFKQQLETENVSDIEIREQLVAFLQYLESSNRYSLDGDDGSPDAQTNDAEMPMLRRRLSSAIEQATAAMDAAGDDTESYRFGDADGIHVYGMNDDNNGLQRQPLKPVICLNDYEL